MSQKAGDSVHLEHCEGAEEQKAIFGEGGSSAGCLLFGLIGESADWSCDSPWWVR